MKRMKKQNRKKRKKKRLKIYTELKVWIIQSVLSSAHKM